MPIDRFFYFIKSNIEINCGLMFSFATVKYLFSK
jgi:hypothetical protein